MKIGYARVSTREQRASLQAQRGSLTDAGCARIFEDVISGARSQRPGLDAAKDYLRPGDTLVVTRLDRLGRSLTDTIFTVRDLKNRDIRLLTLDMSLDSGTPAGEFTINVLCLLADQELEHIRARTREGLDYARKQGRFGGRPPKLSPESQQAALVALEAGMSMREVALVHNVSPSTIKRLRARQASAATE
ncbi:recombinase family protein [Kocuria carniphila]|uniref:recombinase family protein n=1 Tax=Kocuria carniphila TaxID=262208 RepID=UPI0034CF6D2A